MIRMNMRFQDQADRETLLPGLFEDGIDGCCTGLAGLVLIVEHGIDDGGLPRLRIGHEIAYGICRFVEEGMDDGLRHDKFPRIRILLDYILEYPKLSSDKSEDSMAVLLVDESMAGFEAKAAEATAMLKALANEK